MLKPCIDCGQPAPGSRCTECKVERARAGYVRAADRRGTTAERGYGSRWRRLSERARARQPWCSVCGTSEDLTVDHLVPLAAGGPRHPRLGDVIVLCRSCNSRKGARLPTYDQPPLLPGA